MKKILLSLMIFGCFGAAGQVKNFSVSVSANYPFINSVTESAQMSSPPLGAAGYTSYYTSTLAGVQESYKGKTGLDISTKIDYGFSNHFFLSTGLSIHYLRFDRHVKVVLPRMQSSGTSGMAGVPMGSIFGQGSSSGSGEHIPITNAPRKDKTTLYLSLPVLLGTSLLADRLILRAGVTISVLLEATAYTSSYSFASQIFSENKESSTKGYNSFLSGGAFQATYLVTKSLGIDLSGQRSFTPIYTGGKSRYTTVSLGLSYNFPLQVSKLVKRI